MAQGDPLQRKAPTLASSRATAAEKYFLDSPLFTGAYSWLSHAHPMILAISLTWNLMWLLTPWAKLVEVCPTYTCVATAGVFRRSAVLAPQDPDYGWLVRVMVGLLALWVGSEVGKKWYKLATLPRAEIGDKTSTDVARLYNWGVVLKALSGGLALLLCIGSTGGLGPFLALAGHSWAAPRVVTIIIAWVASEMVMSWYKMLSVNK